MSLMFYPYAEDVALGSLSERIESLMEAAERYKAAVLETVEKGSSSMLETRYPAPKDIPIAYNWDAIAVVLREIRELKESSNEAKKIKARHLIKLAEIYEVLRAAKMSKLEAVRLALTTEATQLQGGGSKQVA